MIQIEMTTAAAAALVPNTWNPNVMNERQYAAAQESIAAFGFIDPITVRPSGQTDAGDVILEIIDGEHRHRAAVEAGHDMVPVVILHGCGDMDARKLTAILNETRGTADLHKLADLLAGLGQEPSALLVGLPYTPGELDALLALTIPPDLAGGGDLGGHEPGDWTTITCTIPGDALPIVKDAFERFFASREQPRTTDIAYGQLLEAACADLLAGA